MLYTITLSPSIDYLIEDTQPTFNPHGLNRIEQYQLLPGGKGINASVILNRLKIPNKAIYFGGGTTCELFEQLLIDEKLELIKIAVNDNVRINVKYFNTNQHFEINGPKPKLNVTQTNQLLKLLESLKTNDIVMIMGQCEPTLLITIIQAIVSKKAQFIIDIDDPILWDVLKYHPIVIKPNIDELSRLVQHDVKQENDIIDAMQKLQIQGAKNIIVSCGSKGSYLLTDDQQLFKITLQTPVKVISTVGAGDTLLAGFIANLIKKQNVADAILQATALSLGTVSRQWLAECSDIDQYQHNIIVTKLK